MGPTVGFEKDKYADGLRDGYAGARNAMLDRIKYIWRFPCPKCDENWDTCICSDVEIIEYMFRELIQVYDENANLCVLLDEAEEDRDFWKEQIIKERNQKYDYGSIA
jgi:hypothetical protein